MSDFTVSDLLYVKETIGGICDYNKSCERECKIVRIYSDRSGKIMVTKVFDEYGYSDNMSTKHCELSDVEWFFLFKCSGCGKYKHKCKHGIMCKCNPDCINEECIQCILFERVESGTILDKNYGDYFHSSSYQDTYEYKKMSNKIIMDAVVSAKKCDYGVEPLYDCLYDDIMKLHKDIYKYTLHRVCFDTFCLVNHKRCGKDSPMNGLYYDVRDIIRTYVYID